MSRHERYGTRDLSMSAWHRTLPDNVTCIDVDFMEYCRHCRKPLALIEAARDVGQGHKTTAVLGRAAAAVGIPAFCVLYTPSESHDGVLAFRVRQVHPKQTAFKKVNPVAFGEYLTRIHDNHELICDERR